MAAKWLSNSVLLFVLAIAGTSLIRDVRPSFLLHTDLDHGVVDPSTSLEQAQKQIILHRVRHLERLGRLDALASPVTIPFEYVGGHILISAEIHDLDRPQTLIMDSGLRSTLLDQELGLAPTLSTPFQVDRAASYGLLDSVSLAEARFHSVGTFVTEFSAPGHPLYCLSDSGVIGANMMRHATWQINYQNRTLTVANSVQELEDVADAIAVPFTLVNLSPAIALKLGDNLPVQVLIDTGWSGGIHIAYPDFMALDAEQFKQVSTSEELTETLRGLGIMNQMVMQVPTLSLGELTLENFSTLVSYGENAQPYSLLGNEFLEHFIVTLDWSTHRLYLKPVSALGEIYPKAPDYGFQAVIRDRHLLIAGLQYPSPAARAGLHIGDRILAIDNDTYTTIGDQQACAFVLSPVGDRYSGPITMTVERQGRLLTYNITPEPTARSSAN
jgi:hypothetical protein